MQSEKKLDLCAQQCRKRVMSLLLKVSAKGRGLGGEEAGSPLKSRVSKGRVGQGKIIFHDVLEMCLHCNHFVSENFSQGN